MRNFFLSLALAVAASSPVLAQDNLQSTIVKHLKTSRDFCLKVAEAMPDSDYSFKLTPAQMSFGQQMTHLSQGMTYFLSPFSGEKPHPGKPKSDSKADVIEFMKASFDKAIDTVSKLTPEQISKTYKNSGETATGADLLIGMLEHNAHHRASAEMYLRAKGITPPQYQA